MKRYWNLSLLVNNLRQQTVKVIGLPVIVLCASCQFDGLENVETNIEMLPELSGYNIFQGNPAHLIPSNGFHLYELSTELFTDYAEKQRLIKIPPGQSMTALGDKLPDFPDGTILVKTFYYYNDKRDTTKGRKIIETRLEIKSNSKWNVGTYLWNEQQTEAKLITTGLNKTINWVNQNGSANVISYHIPSTRECATCHSSSKAVIPIGPKLRNLSIEVIRNASTINQLTYFSNLGLINSVNPASILVLPDWKNTVYTIEDRARAYLDVNCAHCHSSTGHAADTKFFLNYELNYASTGIGQRKDEITTRMSRGQMPLLGTTIVHQEGLDLIRTYINGL